jgi:hypothetical protein
MQEADGQAFRSFPLLAGVQQESAGENLYHLSPLRHKFPFQVVFIWRCWPRPARGSGIGAELLWDIESIVKQGRDGPALDIPQ